MNVAWALRLSVFAALCIWLIWTGARPGKEHPRAWYDRTIRIVGGVLLLLAILGGVLVEFGSLR